MLGKNLKQSIEQVYALDEVIGSGSYGIIFKAFRLSDRQTVAIKCFVSGDDIPQNCLNELKLIFRLQHPHIVKALDVFFAKKAYALVFEYMNAGDLRQHMKYHPIHAAQAFLLVSQVASGLSLIHKQNIVHRDIKPENILVHQQENQVFYKLADFNISRFAAVQQLRATDRGSPLYMAPEQFYDTYDHRADLYALGIILYELLSGRPPFEGSYRELMQQHIQKEPEYADIPALARPLLERLLAKKPAERYENTAALLEDLNPLLLKLSHTGSILPLPSSPRDPVLTFDENKGAFYLKYLHQTLWTEWIPAED